MTDKNADWKAKAEELMDRTGDKAEEAKLHLQANAKSLENDAKDAARKLGKNAKKAADTVADKARELVGKDD